jgi:serine/threonine protein kinase
LNIQDIQFNGLIIHNTIFSKSKEKAIGIDISIRTIPEKIDRGYVTFRSLFKINKHIIYYTKEMAEKNDVDTVSICLEGAILDNRWLAIACIGRGAFATVWLVRDISTPEKSDKNKGRQVHPNMKKNNVKEINMNHRYYVLKVFASDEGSTFKHELKLMNLFQVSDCVGNVKVLDSFKHKLDGETHGVLVLPLCRGSILSACKGKGCNMTIMRSILKQTFNSIIAIHETGYSHGDIKPENILAEGISPKVAKLINSVEKRIDFTNFVGNPKRYEELSRIFTKQVLEKLDRSKFDIEGVEFDIDENVNVVVSDFGTCRKYDSGISVEKTVYYCGPEGLLDVEIPDNRKTDIWNIACTAYELATGDILFDWFAENADDAVQLQSTITSIIKTVGQDAAMVEMMRNSKVFCDPPENSKLSSMQISPIFTADGMVKGALKLKPMPLMTKMAISLEKPIDNDVEIGNFIDLLYAMLETDPAKRPDLKELIYHPFFTEIPQKMPQKIES